MKTSEAIRLSAELEDLRAVVIRLLGDKWPERVAALEPAIRLAMRRQGTDSPIAAVLPAAKEMTRDGKNPMIMVAVAVDMAMRG